MKWFRILTVAAVTCATVALGIWGTYGLIGETLSDGASAIAIGLGLLAVTLGGGALVALATRSQRHSRR